MKKRKLDEIPLSYLKKEQLQMRYTQRFPLPPVSRTTLVHSLTNSYSQIHSLKKNTGYN